MFDISHLISVILILVNYDYNYKDVGKLEHFMHIIL